MRESIAPRLSDKARRLINSLYGNGFTEEVAIANILDEVACNGGGQELDSFLVSVAQGLRDSCDWFLKEMEGK